MHSGYRTAAFAALVLLATISRGIAQITCFTTEYTGGGNCRNNTVPRFNAASIEECCLSPNGTFFEDPVGNCTACIVFGWINGTVVTLEEQTSVYTLQAGFIKGRAVQTFVADQVLASFQIAIAGRGAVEGVNNDFLVPDTEHSLFGQNPSPFSVPVTVRLDGVALEPAEEFVLSLGPDNMIAMDILAAVMPGVIALPEITVVIRDVENVSLQFTEIDYSRTEDLGFIQPQLQLSTTIAANLSVEIVPLNLTYARDNMLLPESLDPQRDPNFDPITQTATSGDDFSVTPVQITFDSERSPETIEFNIQITNDTIHEADQIFVLRLEVISDIDRNRLVPERTDGLTSVGRILDDDIISIGFEQQRYTVFEADANGDVTPIPVFKANGLESELQFDVIAQISDQTTEVGTDYLAAERPTIPFRGNQQFVDVLFELLPDGIPEDVEEFTIELTTSDAPRVTIGGGLFGRATVVIIDDDELTIGWERNLTVVNEAQGSLELCLIIRNVTELNVLTGFSVMLFIGTVRGTAVDPGDYMELRSADTFISITGETRRGCIAVDIINDTLLEEVEFFSVQAVPPSNGLPSNIQLEPDLTFVEILDNDRVVIGLERTVYTVEERDRIVEVCTIVRQGSLAREAIVTLSSVDRTALAPADYQVISEMLIFDQQMNRICRNISIEDDAIIEPSEVFNVTLSTIDTSVTLDPEIGTVMITDDDVVGVLILVNDTVIGDPLFKVPIYVPNIEDLDLEADGISLCYEVHGEANQWFNLVTDECTSVNAHYTNFTDFSDPDFNVNVINRVAIRAVDESTTCRQIMIDLAGCSVQLDGVPLVDSRYSANGIRIRRYPRRVRVAVPNCRELSVIMWITCETQDVEIPFTDEIVTGDMIRVDVMRGLNFGHQDSHGLIGQYWSVPINLTQYDGTLRDGGSDTGRYVIGVSRDGSLVKEFTGSFSSILWDQTDGPCLYAGNRQAGPIYEVEDPNDGVIDGLFSDYRVPSAFDETGYLFGRFEENMCQ